MFLGMQDFDNVQI